MLYILFQRVVSEEEAAKLTNRKMVKFTDKEFITKIREHDLNSDEFFAKCVREIDKCDIPVPNVLRDLLTGNTHSFDKVSGGTMAMWLLYHYNSEYIMPSAYFGENCYNILVEMSKVKDIYIYEDSNMMANDECDECNGVFTDFHTGSIVQFGEEKAFDYVIERGY